MNLQAMIREWIRRRLIPRPIPLTDRVPPGRGLELSLLEAAFRPGGALVAKVRRWVGGNREYVQILLRDSAGDEMIQVERWVAALDPETVGRTWDCVYFASLLDREHPEPLDDYGMADRIGALVICT